MKVIENLYQGEFPPPGELLDSLEPLFPLIGEMAATPQDSEWHAEGNVRVHTEMVISEAYQLDLPAEEKAVVILAAVLHDIGKSLTTREVDIEGRMRTISPRHAERGCNYIAPLMGQLELSVVDIQRILGLVRYHHDPRKMVANEVGRPKYAQLARSVDLRLLYFFELCDNRGRICNDIEEQLEILELFRIEAENFGLWENPNPYLDWQSFLANNIPNKDEYKYALGLAVHEYERGVINSPEEALARSWQNRKDYCQMTLVSAPAGSGKSTWVKEHFDSDAVVISLDAIRGQVTGKRSDQSKNGQVLQAGKEQLRQALRDKRDVFWDSTALRRDARAMVLGLAHDYHAATRLIAFGVPPNLALKRNKSRVDPVPVAVIEKQYRIWQWPELCEAHVVEHYFDGKE